MSSKITDKINALLKDEVAVLGYELWGCLYTQVNKTSILRVMIEKEGGVTIDDCAVVARHIGTVLDVESPITWAYRLEVSSPGLDRPLFELSHYQRNIGKIVKLRLHLPHEGQRNFVGILVSADGDKGIVIADEQQELCVQLAEIERANLELEI
ncbi:MAG: ribosome maturation factor RimP [Legionellales bacterium]|nr:ribosome maturation factor RimP [Legionellales bacterium]|tara:strand:- start:13 stop:474 length:462 start_codon:yes stop_codon:yes gene_type:complete